MSSILILAVYAGLNVAAADPRVDNLAECMKGFGAHSLYSTGMNSKDAVVVPNRNEDGSVSGLYAYAQGAKEAQYYPFAKPMAEKDYADPQVFNHDVRNGKASIATTQQRNFYFSTDTESTPKSIQFEKAVEAAAQEARRKANDLTPEKTNKRLDLMSEATKGIISPTLHDPVVYGYDKEKVARKSEAVKGMQKNISRCSFVPNEEIKKAGAAQAAWLKRASDKLDGLQARAEKQADCAKLKADEESEAKARR